MWGNFFIGKQMNDWKPTHICFGCNKPAYSDICIFCTTTMSKDIAFQTISAQIKYHKPSSFSSESKPPEVGVVETCFPTANIEKHRCGVKFVFNATKIFVAVDQRNDEFFTCLMYN